MRDLTFVTFVLLVLANDKIVTLFLLAKCFVTYRQVFSTFLASKSLKFSFNCEISSRFRVNRNRSRTRHILAVEI